MIGIVCALRAEAPKLAAGAVVAVGGMGRANAGRAAEALAARHRLTGLIAAGFAGALTPDLRAGDVVIDTEVAAWRAAAERSGAALGRIATVDRIIRTGAERRALAASTGALAVDMESDAVAEVARRHALPFAAVRSITDTPERDLVLDWNSYRRADGGIRFLRLFLHVVRTPNGVEEIRQLWYASRLASRRLGQFLGKLLGNDGHFS